MRNNTRHNRRFAIAISFLAICIPPGHGNRCIAENHSDKVMTEQADSFRHSIPESQKHIQTEAVRKAIAGDTSDLDRVRAARDKQPSISHNVRTTDLTPGLRLYEPACGTEENMPLLIYLHGGGWTFGSINSCGRFCDAVAATGKAKVMAVGYRLAPEAPYPAGLNDCKDAIRYAIENRRSLGIDPEHISIGGDSAGGNLAIATALSPECAGMAESLILFYPVTKAFADNSDSWKRYGEGYGLDASLMDEFNRAYASGSPSGIPFIDVGLASDDDLGRLPCTLLVAAGRDILRDQGEEFATRLSPGKITRIEFPGAVHLFITVPGQEEAFRTSVRLAIDFITDNSQSTP